MRDGRRQGMHALGDNARSQAVQHGARRVAAGLVVQRHRGGWRAASLGAQGQAAVYQTAALGRQRGLDGLLHQVVREGVVGGFMLAQQLGGQGLLDGQHGVQLRQCTGRCQQRRRKGFAGQGCGLEHAAGRFGQALHP